MTNRLNLGLLILFVLAAWPLAARAQGGPGDMWQTFTTGDGVSSGYVLAAFRASDGTLWFGTEAGASRYDGRWSDALTERNGLPAGRVRNIAQTADGALWFATEGGGVARQPANGVCCAKYTVADGLPSDDVRSLFASERSGVWAGTAAGLAQLQGERFAPVDALAGIPVLALGEAPDGALWAATRDRGVWTLPAGGAWRLVDGSDLVRGQLFSLHVGASGRVWVGTENGLAYFEDQAWRRWPLRDNDAGLRVFALLEDRDGGLWAGTGSGLYYDSTPAGFADLHVTAQRNGLVSNDVRDLVFDGDGALWVGTIAGVNRYAGFIWQTVREVGLAGRPINAIVTDRSGQTWVGTDGNGLAVWDGASWRWLTAADGLSDKSIFALFEDAGGRLWVGTPTSVAYRAASGAWRVFGPADGLVGMPVFSFEQGSGDQVWLATEGGALSWSESSGFTRLPGLNGKRVNSIRRRADGSLWFGTAQDGIFHLVGGVLAPVNGPAGVPVKIVAINGLVEGAEGQLWVNMYDDGLWRYADGQWSRMDAALATPKVLSANYFGGSLWVGTRVGLDRFDGKTWQSYVGAVLPNPEVFAIAPGAEGTVWIGTGGGLTHYRGEHRLPWLHVNSVNFMAPRNDLVTLGSNILQAVRLDAGDLATRPENLRYLVQLLGVDAAPRLYTEELITYEGRSLAPGEYVLRAWVRDEAFNYSEPADVRIAVPRMVVLPGGWQVRAEMFYTGLGGGLLALIGIVGASAAAVRSRRSERRQANAILVRQREALERHFNPFISGEPVRQPEMFFGRDELLHKVVNALHQNSIMIHAERRMGKTTLLYQLAEQLRQSDDQAWVFVPVMIDVEGTPQEQFFHMLMDAIWGVLRGYLTQDPPVLQFHTLPEAEYSYRELQSDLNIVLDCMKAVVAPRRVRVILLMDEMDAINAYDTLTQQQLRRVFMSALAENLGAVVAGVQISKAWDSESSPWYNLFNEMSLEPFDDESARKLLIEPVRGVYTWAAEAVAHVVACAGGRPYRLQQFGLEAVNSMLAAGRMQITLDDVKVAERLLDLASGRLPGASTEVNRA